MNDSKLPATLANIEKITPKPDDVEKVSEKAGNAKYRKAFEDFLSKSKDEESESETEDELISKDYVLDEEDTSIKRAQNSIKSGDGNLSLLRAYIVLTSCYNPQYTETGSEDEASIYCLCLAAGQKAGVSIIPVSGCCDIMPEAVGPLNIDFSSKAGFPNGRHPMDSMTGVSTQLYTVNQ